MSTAPRISTSPSSRLADQIMQRLRCLVPATTTSEDAVSESRKPPCRFVLVSGLLAVAGHVARPGSPPRWPGLQAVVLALVARVLFLVRERADAPQLAATSKRLGASAILVRPTAS
jgi:hypothetical protein